jgi:hypothetical protein
MLFNQTHLGPTVLQLLLRRLPRTAQRVCLCCRSRCTGLFGRSPTLGGSLTTTAKEQEAANYGACTVGE